MNISTHFNLAQSCFLILMLITSMSFLPYPVYAVAEDVQEALIFFDKPVKVEEAFNLLSEYDVQIVEIGHRFNLGDQTEHWGFMPIPNPPPTPREIETQLRQRFHEFLRTEMKLRFSIKHSVEDERHDDGAKAEPIRIDQVRIKVTEQVLASVKKEQSRWTIASVQIQSRKQLETEKDVPTASISSIGWLPKQVTIEIQPVRNNPSKRYINQRMYWDNTSGFSTNSTYEPDLFLDNVDGTTYLDQRQDALGIPLVDYWASNFPSAYLDTRFLDSNDRKAFTVGSASASSIQANQWYYTYILTKATSVTIDKGWWMAQRGYRNPTSCYSTWCVFPSETVCLASTWILVPGYYTWNR